MPVRVWMRSLALLGVLGLSAWGLGRLARLGSWFFGLATLIAVLLLAALLLTAWMLLPDLDRPGRTLRRGPRGAGAIAITFDDGPNGGCTERVLEVLARHGARATFFCTGAAARRAPGLVRRLVAEGHEVGNHTLSHALLPRLSREATRREVVAATQELRRAGVPDLRLFRAPKGWKNRHLPAVLREQGLRLVGWTRGVWDTDRPGVEAIVRRARPALRDGAILLLHDGLPGEDRSQTAAALEGILTECRRRGLRAVTVGELTASAVDRQRCDPPMA